VLVPLFLGFAAGVAAVVALQRHRHRQHNRAGAGPASSALTAAQLLAWIDAADQGWMVLGSDLRITYINDRAERLLRLSRNRLVRGKPLNDVLSIPQEN